MARKCKKCGKPGHYSTTCGRAEVIKRANRFGTVAGLTPAVKVAPAVPTKPVRCGSCWNSGIKKENGKETRCPCGRIPSRSLKEIDMDEHGPTEPYRSTDSDSVANHTGQSIKTIDVDPGRFRSEKFTECRVCKTRTTEGKPYCIEHLDNLPYAAKLMAERQERDDEEAVAMGSWRKVDTKSSRSQEILCQVAHGGAMTPARLAIKLEVQKKAMWGYCMALQNVGLVQILKLGSRRGTPRMVVDLTDSGKSEARRLLSEEANNVSGISGTAEAA